MSKLEQRITDILNTSKIRYQTEKQFRDLHGGWYRYDFYLPDLNILLEGDGAQHYQFTPIFHKKRSDFTKAQERDRIKNSYALSHNIKLYRIPYWDLENLMTFEDLCKPQYLVSSKFHNDIIWREHQKKKEP